MTAKPFLMGSEVEYSMSSRDPGFGRRRALMHQLLIDAIRGQHCWLPDMQTPTGIYLDNGSRYYLDSGHHNELSSPEMFTPRQIATYDRAGEQILLRAKVDAEANARGGNICITKNNVNFNVPDRAAWGQHEAYTCWIPLDAAATQLIPHLVSRIPYASAGCLSSHKRGMGFELSQRARHMTRSVGQETMHDRAIFCTRAWKPSDVSTTGWTRTNLISKDSQRCAFGMYLTFGVTGLLFMIMNSGHRLGRHVQLKNPVAAMRAFSLDPSLKTTVPLASGKQATAIDIQRSYLREAQPHVESGELPEWTHEVLKYWAETLEQLDEDPRALAPCLDTYLKLTIFERQLNRAGMSWSELRNALQGLDRMRSMAPECAVHATLLNEDLSEYDDEVQRQVRQLKRAVRIPQAKLERLRLAIRLQALELNYHELGGLFDQMSQTGRVNHVVTTPSEIESAMHAPPAGGRAEARSKAISRHHGEPDWLCDWQFVFHRAGEKWFDFRDPFADFSQVTTSLSEFPLHADASDLATRLARLL